MARRDFEPAEVQGITKRVEAMFGSAPEPGFAEKYVPILQRSVDVAVNHASLRNAVAKLR
jgi:hypothetical protein